MSFAAFMELALYHPEFGYYRRPHRRIGRQAGTDFYTATSAGPVFGELIAAAAGELLGNQTPRDYKFVEIGAEPGAGVLHGVNHPFAQAQTLGVGAEIDLKGRLIVFSNELFDAQPFNRYVYRAGAWRELGVKLTDTTLAETILPSAPLPEELPAHAAEGYVIDAPLAASGLMRKIASQPWHGLLIACDYGKTWRELTGALPAGTARAYHQHRQSNDLLARPGQQDLTCHVCWDWLVHELTVQGFQLPQVESQESFFVRHAGNHLQTVIAAEAATLSHRKLAITQLIHPTHLGHKFQVLHALRSP
jgi:SAM-dependent MidA family methyltransferase